MAKAKTMRVVVEMIEAKVVMVVMKMETMAALMVVVRAALEDTVAKGSKARTAEEVEEKGWGAEAMTEATWRIRKLTTRFKWWVRADVRGGERNKGAGGEDDGGGDGGDKNGSGADERGGECDEGIGGGDES